MLSLGWYTCGIPILCHLVEIQIQVPSTEQVATAMIARERVAAAEQIDPSYSRYVASVCSPSNSGFLARTSLPHRRHLDWFLLSVDIYCESTHSAYGLLV